jgi:hypothetical protein
MVEPFGDAAEQHSLAWWIRASLISQALLAGYVQLLGWFPLVSLDRRSRIFTGLGLASRLLSIVPLAVFGVLPALLFRLASRKQLLRRLMWICVSYYSALLSFEVGWWRMHEYCWPGLPKITILPLVVLIVLSSTMGLAKLERLEHKPFPLWIFR